VANHDSLDLVEADLFAPAIVESCTMRVEAWFAIAAAFSGVPPFLRYAARARRVCRSD